MPRASRRKTEALMATDYQRLAEFRSLLRQFMRFSEQAAGGAGLTPQQHQALLAVKGFGGAGPLTIGELAERLGIRHNSAVGLVDRLLANSLVKRQSGAEDRREVLLTLTAKADRILAELSTAHRDELQRIAPLLQDSLKHFKRSK
jgi:DNA-binding MarR family transcriptional regulator